jgi:hypothetical protein
MFESITNYSPPIRDRDRFFKIQLTRLIDGILIIVTAQLQEMANLSQQILELERAQQKLKQQ